MGQEAHYLSVNSVVGFAAAIGAGVGAGADVDAGVGTGVADADVVVVAGAVAGVVAAAELQGLGTLSH